MTPEEERWIKDYVAEGTYRWREELRIGGVTRYVPAALICEHKVVVTGSLLRMAAVKDEEFLGEEILDPAAFIEELKASGLRADIFNFARVLPATRPWYSYYFEWDNRAVVQIATYQDWLASVPADVRKAIRKAERLGVEVRPTKFDDRFVEGIVGVYNDNPIRQGKAFWHYQKDFETVKHENSTFFDKSEFIGAYFGDELIGFIKMVYVSDSLASTLQVISKVSHYDKKSTNALLAKAVEICAAKGITRLVYGKYVYDDPTSSLTEFKRRHGFEQVSFPRYFVPLSWKGKTALRLKLHRGIKSLVPRSLFSIARKVRASWY